jgi:MYXO-CTERM domain-containing protein
MRRTVATIVLMLASLCGAAARGQTFPATFAPLFCQRGFMIDGYRDQAGAIDDRDLVGTTDRPAGFRAVDAQFLYLRLRLDGSPVQGSGLTQFAWGFEFDTDGDPTTYEILIAVDGASQVVGLYSNPTTTVPDSPADPADQLIMSYPFAQYGRVVDAGPSIFGGGGTDSFLDMAVPWSDLGMLGLGPASLAAIWAASSTNPDRLNGDFACHDGGGAGNIPSLSGTRPAPTAVDPARAGNIVANSGIEGGPGCNCHVGGSGEGRGTIVMVLLGVTWIAARRRSFTDARSGPRSRR